MNMPVGVGNRNGGSVAQSRAIEEEKMAKEMAMADPEQQKKTVELAGQVTQTAMNNANKASAISNEAVQSNTTVTGKINQQQQQGQGQQGGGMPSMPSA